MAAGRRPNILFVSRWDEDKGMERQLSLARQLRRAAGPDVRILGLNWGPGAGRAAEAGVTLLDRMSQEEYHRVMSGAHVAVGQATNNFATSEFEALCMGLPLAAVGTRLPRPDDGSTPPVLEGTEDDVVAQVLEALKDPRAVVRARWAGQRGRCPATTRQPTWTAWRISTGGSRAAEESAQRMERR